MKTCLLLLVVPVTAACHSTTPRLGWERGLRTTSAVVYYHSAIGAGPTVFTRDDGTVLDERRYEPFGAGIGPIDYALDPHNVLNKESDADTGWSDHGARWMAPETGRWLTPDPPVKAPDTRFMSEPWALHPYQYVEQNPVLFWDPDGRQPARSESTDDEDTPGDEIKAGFLAFLPGLGQLPGLKIAIAPLQSDRVSTPAKVAYAIVAPIPIFVLGQLSEGLHLGEGIGHIAKGTVRAVFMSAPKLHTPLIDVPAHEDTGPITFKNRAMDDPPPAEPKVSPTPRPRPYRPPPPPPPSYSSCRDPDYDSLNLREPAR